MPKCPVSSCEKDIVKRGYCYSHYKRWYKYGDATLGQRARESHGLSRIPEYTSWLKMKTRCGNPNDLHYPDYGGRGIAVCDTWLDSFTSFYNDVGAKPSPQHTIDRVDVNGNYEPSNCRWATKSEQSFNQRVRVDNKTGYKGVIYDKSRSKYRAEIRFNKKKYNLGRFKTAKEANEAYLEKRHDILSQNDQTC